MSLRVQSEPQKLAKRKFDGHSSPAKLAFCLFQPEKSSIEEAKDDPGQEDCKTEVPHPSENQRLEYESQTGSFEYDSYVESVP